MSSNEDSYCLIILSLHEYEIIRTDYKLSSRVLKVI